MLTARSANRRTDRRWAIARSTVSGPSCRGAGSAIRAGSVAGLSAEAQVNNIAVAAEARETARNPSGGTGVGEAEIGSHALLRHFFAVVVDGAERGKRFVLVRRDVEPDLPLPFEREYRQALVQGRVQAADRTLVLLVRQLLAHEPGAAVVYDQKCSSIVAEEITTRGGIPLREMSGRLEEIPGEEAFPAYLESVVAGFYERAGRVRLKDGSTGSVTIGGTVSPAGGNFDEPVTQATLKVVGAFHGLSRARSDARRYPAIDPLESWSKYTGIAPVGRVEHARDFLRRGNDVAQMMKVVGEEGTSMDDFILYLKSELVDAVYLQQDAFNEVDSATPVKRQREVFNTLGTILAADFAFDDKDAARRFFLTLTQAFKDWHHAPWDSEAFKTGRNRITSLLAEATDNA